MEGCICFSAHVSQSSSNDLKIGIRRLIDKGMTKLHLILNTPGGFIQDGIYIYNMLKGLPIEVNTINHYRADLSGLMLFCAGKNRYCSDHARFILHAPKYTINSSDLFYEDYFNIKILDSIKENNLKIIEIISENSNLEEEEIIKLIRSSAILHENRALKMGIVTEIKVRRSFDKDCYIEIYDKSLPVSGWGSCSPEYEIEWKSR